MRKARAQDDDPLRRLPVARLDRIAPHIPPTQGPRQHYLSWQGSGDTPWPMDRRGQARPIGDAPPRPAASSASTLRPPRLAVADLHYRAGKPAKHGQAGRQLEAPAARPAT